MGLNESGRVTLIPTVFLFFGLPLTEGEISSSFLPVKIYFVSLPIPLTEHTATSSEGHNVTIKHTYVLGDKVDLGVTVLSSLGGGHVDNFARSSLDEDVTRLPQTGTLHAEEQRQLLAKNRSSWMPKLTGRSWKHRLRQPRKSRDAPLQPFLRHRISF